MRAVILAGGKGTRLRPYTTLIPKPLVPLGGKYSILELIILQLKRAGFTHVTLAVNHLSQLIMAYFGDGSRLGVELDYSLEEVELSTIGPLTLIKDLPDDFLVMNGDILCDLDYRSFYERHVTEGRKVSVSAFRREVKIDFGVLGYDESGQLTSFSEKPTYRFDVSMGIYCINRTVIESLPVGKPYGFDNLMHDGLQKRELVHIQPFGGYWLDIGRPDDYQFADDNFAELAGKLGIDLD
ncbi:sugar phosphate nucleotidyltransferase [Variovorax sp. J22P271]|uniref:nucleotidyltransferase family protein n=1 Tax=Variovorax davisae TaxID=3053515 RepID=UPI002575B234|nr:sugar phosphate nucleotidyltransferase [Variovorax sp. J22P271]MDM0033304.1 sugar phosphate nucleotidyltransferase [Variovorax sp. J22P271]